MGYLPNPDYLLCRGDCPSRNEGIPHFLGIDVLGLWIVPRCRGTEGVLGSTRELGLESTIYPTMGLAITTGYRRVLCSREYVYRLHRDNQANSFLSLLSLLLLCRTFTHTLTGPWYLIRMERDEDAKKALVRLACKGYYTETRLEQQLALMKHTNEKDKVDAANASYADCFRGTNRRRTEIACITFLIQIMSGQAICSYATVL
jgi:hypothetical protein